MLIEQFVKVGAGEMTKHATLIVGKIVDLNFKAHTVTFELHGRLAPAFTHPFVTISFHDDRKETLLTALKDSHKTGNSVVAIENEHGFLIHLDITRPIRDNGTVYGVELDK